MFFIYSNDHPNANIIVIIEAYGKCAVALVGELVEALQGCKLGLIFVQIRFSKNRNFHCPDLFFFYATLGSTFLSSFLMSGS